MKVIHLLILLLFSSSLLSYSTSFTDREKIRKNAHNYNRFIFPQLRGMFDDFYHALKKINPLEGELISNRKTFNDFIRNFNLWQKECVEVSTDCTKQLVKNYKLLRNNYKQIISLYDHLINDSNNYSDDYLKSRNKLTELEDIIFSLQHKIESLLMTSDPTYFISDSNRQDFYLTTHHASLINDTLVCRFVDSEIRDDFELIWTNFFVPIDQYIIRPNNTEYLVNELGSLNILWNNFHLKMSKGNKLTPEKISSQLTNMHNRWNSILKLYLRDSEI